MEFVERFFGTKKRRQERLISELGISGELRKELIGPEYEDVVVVKVDNDQFIQLLHSRKPAEVLSNVVHRSDTHAAYDLYIGIGRGIKVKTGASQVDYSHERTLFNDLYEMGYKYKSIEPKTKIGQYGWGVYKMEETKDDS
ncbi:MAG: hypothetical protein Q7R97_01425 [Candidatus Daviesbacteria bacterium]|nr:hypothetical protein [Candidatus Daviesbacteria bacterium]